MKKNVFPICLFMISCVAIAQEVNEIPLKEIPAKYIIADFRSKTLFGKSYLIIDYGQVSAFTFEKERRRIASLKENDNEMQFNSEIDAINYLAENGYKLIESSQDIETNVYNEVSSVSRKFLLENLNYGNNR